MAKTDWLGLTSNVYSAAQIRRRMRYASFVSRRHRLLFVETPKAACTSLKWVMAEIEGAAPKVAARGRESQLEMAVHFRDAHPLPALTDLPAAEAREALGSAEWARFCAVRHPYSRLIAAWSNKIRQIEPGYSSVCAAVNRHCGRPDDGSAPAFRDFARWVFDANDAATCDPHWRPQTLLLLPDSVRYDVVMKTETLAADLQRVFDAGATTRALDAAAVLAKFRHNESLPVSYDGLYDEALARRAHDWYAADFARFGYAEGSWRDIAQRKRAPSFAELEAAALSAVQQRNRFIEDLQPGKRSKPVKLLAEARKGLRRVFGRPR